MTSHELLVANREAKKLARTFYGEPKPEPARREIDRSKPNVPLGIPVKSG